MVIYAQSMIFVDRDGEIREVLNFDYYDSDKYYLEVVKDVERFKEETERIKLSMQEYLDVQRCSINGEKVSSHVSLVDICHRGSQTIVSVSMIILSKGKFRRGLNIYEAWLEKERLKYDLNVYWVFPSEVEIKEFKTSLRVDVHHNIVVLWGRKGDLVGGYENIIFTLPTK